MMHGNRGEQVGKYVGPVSGGPCLKLFSEIMSAVDFGSGTGVHVSEFRKRSVAAEGYEYSPIARNLARTLSGIELKPFDLQTFVRLEQSVDLSISVEVAEHLTKEMGHRLVDLCCEHAPLVIFSAGQPRQYGQGHINLQPKSYWISQFEQRGFRFEKSKSVQLARYLGNRLIRGWYLTENVGIYTKGTKRAVL
jgi:hypothetical protein